MLMLLSFSFAFTRLLIHISAIGFQRVTLYLNQELHLFLNPEFSARHMLHVEGRLILFPVVLTSLVWSRYLYSIRLVVINIQAEVIPVIIYPDMCPVLTVFTSGIQEQNPHNCTINVVSCEDNILYT